MASTGEGRLRDLLEVATAILLGLVSVATAAGAYQASEWAQQSAVYAGAAGQLRDESLASGIASQIAQFDDNERFSQALAIELKIGAGAENPDELREQQARVLEGGSPGLAEGWQRWAAGGFSDSDHPLTDADLLTPQLAPTYGANRASAVAYSIADEIGSRSQQLTVAAAIFALALLLLGVSGANQSLKIAFGLALGGAGAFLVGVVISLLAVIG